MPNPPPQWDQYYPGGPNQQAADWNVAQHSGIYQDPGTHAGPTGPTGPAPSASGIASFRAVMSANQNVGGAENQRMIGKINFDTLVFQQGNYFSIINRGWTPPAGRILLHASWFFNGTACLQTGDPTGDYTKATIGIYKNGIRIASRYVGVTIFDSVGSIDICSGSDVYDVEYDFYNGTSNFGNYNPVIFQAVNYFTFFCGTLLG